MTSFLLDWFITPYQLDFEGRGLGNDDCRELSRLIEETLLLCSSSLVVKINLKRNNIGDEGAVYLSRLLCYQNVRLYLGENCLTNKGDDLLYKVIEERRSEHLPHGDYYLGQNPGVKRNPLEVLFVKGAKEKV